MVHSKAIGHGIAGIETFVDMDLSDDQVHVDDTDVGQLVELLRESILELRLSNSFLSVRSSFGGVYGLRQKLDELLGQAPVFELLCARLGLEVLYGVETHLGRIRQVVGCLPDSEPPERAQKYINDLVNCFLIGFDRQCIIMSRAVVEVLAEDLWEDDDDLVLGKRIGMLKDNNVISSNQAGDMREINRQAREVVHDEPSDRPPSAKQCVELVARLLAQLRPVAWE